MHPVSCNPDGSAPNNVIISRIPKHGFPVLNCLFPNPNPSVVIYGLQIGVTEREEMCYRSDSVTNGDVLYIDLHVCPML